MGNMEERSNASTGLFLRILGRVVLVLPMLVLAGCFLVPEPTVENAEIRLEGTDGIEVLLVTSTQFRAVRTAVDRTEVSVLDGDTLRISLPFDRAYDISTERRFFARVTRAGEGSGRIRMRAFIDGRDQFDETMVATDSTALRFVYVQSGGGSDGPKF